MLIIVIVVSTIIIGGLGFLFWNHFFGSSAKNAIQSSDTHEQVTVSSTEGWSTYSDNYIPFSFKYPSNWTIVDKSHTDKAVMISGFTNYEQSNRTGMVNVFYYPDRHATVVPPNCLDIRPSSECRVVSNALTTGYMYTDSQYKLFSWTGYRGDEEVNVNASAASISENVFMAIVQSLQIR
jgi:hypothetical protein